MEDPAINGIKSSQKPRENTPIPLSQLDCLLSPSVTLQPKCCELQAPGLDGQEHNMLQLSNALRSAALPTRFLFEIFNGVSTLERTTFESFQIMYFLCFFFFCLFFKNILFQLFFLCDLK